MLIVLAHTLKPPSEARIFEKLGITLAENTSEKVEIWGCNLVTQRLGSTLPNLVLKSVFPIKSGISNRINNLGRFWNLLQALKPDLLICCSFDLVPIAILFGHSHSTEVIWDVQENQSLNYQFQSVYKKWHHWFTQHLICLTQKWMLKKVDQVWIAEEIFIRQLMDDAKIPNWTLFENKVPGNWGAPSIFNKNVGLLPYFLFSGFITKESGIERAIYWMENWVRANPYWNLVVCGYCPDANLIQTLVELQRSRHWLILVEIENWKTSYEIRNVLIGSEAVLMPYIESPANLGKKPTKWFEARWAGKRALVQKNGHWKNLDGCLEVDFTSPELCNPENIMHELKSYIKTNSESSDWMFESKKLGIEINQILARLKKRN